MLARMFDACIAERNCAVLTLGNDGISQLHIVQNLYVELLTVEFARSSAETVQLAATDRFNALRAQLAEEQARRLRNGPTARDPWRQAPSFINAGRN
jgi:hypothetical protein